MALYIRTLFATVIFSNIVFAGSNTGVVGLGRTIFEPLCCYGCLASLWGLDLDCTVQENPREPTGSNAQCHSTNTPYLNSLAYCMQVKCALDNVSSSTTETCWSAVAGDGATVGNLQGNLPSTPPTIELAYHAFSLSNTSLVNDQFYENSRTTIEAYVKQETAHALYGTIVVLVVIGFCFCLGLHQAFNHYFPKLSLPLTTSAVLSRYVTSPALLGKIHLRRIPGNLGYVPTRALTVLILLYIAINAAFCAINYPTLKLDTWYISTKKQRISFVADRLGILSFANIALAIMFSGRNTPLLWITGRSRMEILTFHRWIARVAAIQGIVHVVLYWINTSRFGYNMFTLSAGIHTVGFNQIYWTYGIIAVIGLGFMVFVFSMLPVRVAWYESFLVIHIILAVAILFGLWKHVVLRYHKAYGYEVWLYIAFSFWGFDRAVRPLRIVALNWRSWFDKKHPRSIVELLPGDEFMKVTVFPSTTWHFNAGQYCFLYFPTSNFNPFQSHPFSIASWNDAFEPGPTSASPQGIRETSKDESLPGSETNIRPTIELQTLEQIRQPQNGESLATSRPSVSFIIHPEHGLTRSLHKRLLKGNKKTIWKSLPVFVEGPYGSAPSNSLRKAETILAIAGGIGITSILGYLKLYLSSLSVHPENERSCRRSGRASRFVLFWSAREESLITAIKSELADADELRRRGIELTVVCTGQGGNGERLNITQVVSDELESAQNAERSVCIVSCGPGGMADDVRATVVRCNGENGADVELIEDAFGW